MEQTLQSLSDFDVYLLAEGTFDRAYEKLGAHLTERDGRQGVQFAVWAPNAKLVSVVGDFNQWNPAANVMRSSPAGVWESFIPDSRSRRSIQVSRGVQLPRLYGRQNRSLWFRARKFVPRWLLAYGI